MSKLQNFQVTIYPSQNDNTLTGNELQIQKLQKLIFGLYEYNGKIINKNKNVGKLGLEMSSQEKTNLEIIYTYFINLLIENGKNQKFLSIDIMNKKYLKKENLSIGIDSIINNEYFIDVNNFNNNIIIETLKKNGLGRLLDDLLQNIDSGLLIKNSYKQNIDFYKKMLKQNKLDKKQFDIYRKNIHKSYNNSLTKNTYNYIKLCNKIIDIINKNYELQRLGSEIKKQNNDKNEIVNNNRLARRLYKSNGLKYLGNTTKYNNYVYKNKQGKIARLTTLAKNINNDFEKYYIINKNGSFEVIEK